MHSLRMSANEALKSAGAAREAAIAIGENAKTGGIAIQSISQLEAQSAQIARCCAAMRRGIAEAQQEAESAAAATAAAPLVEA